MAAGNRWAEARVTNRKMTATALVKQADCYPIHNSTLPIQKSKILILNDEVNGGEDERRD